MAEPSEGSVAKKPDSDIRIKNHQSGQNSSGGGASASFTYSKKTGNVGDDIPDVSQSTSS